MNKKRHSCAAVRVDLLGNFPNIIVRKVKSRERWIQIISRNTTGHNKKDNYVLHREFYPKEEEVYIERSKET